MKSILFLTIVLFFVISPAHAQLPLSDATGFINRLNIQTSGQVFEIKLVSNFDLTDYRFEKDQKQLILYLESGLENNLGEIIVPKNLLTGNFTFYLNDQEFFPKIQSNDKINFITLNFTGLGTNVVKISSTEYLSGLDEIIQIDDDIPVEPFYDTSITDSSFDNYLIWIIVGGVAIIVVFIVMKFVKNKN